MTNLDTTSINTHAILTQPIHTLEKFYSVNTQAHIKKLC